MTQALHPDKQETYSDQPEGYARFVAMARRLLLGWPEALLILFISAFFRLARIDTVIFNDDEAGVFRLAHDAIVSGWLPLTSNRASLGNLNPPLVVYFFMLPASLSANPLWGEVLVALFNTAAVLLTYFFVRRYYGRLAGTVAALLFATSVGAWTFSRNIWPQNFLPFFVILFIFVLFLGLVERRKGWFFWAIVLLGVLYQFHGSTLYLLIPLAAAVIFAYKTIRLRDILLSLVALLLLFSPYIIWEWHTHFADVLLLFDLTKQQTHIDTEALHFYLFFIHPTLIKPYIDLSASFRDNHINSPNGSSILAQSHLHLFIQGVYLLGLLLLLGGILIASVQILADSASDPHKHRVVRWWHELRASSYKQGLVLILLWQIAPLLLLTRHSVVLFAHYFIFLLPGPFILMALCIAQIVALVKYYRPALERITRYSIYALAMVVILGQLIGISSAFLDMSAGHFSSAAFNDLHDAQNALYVANQIAQQRHIQRVYVTSSTYSTTRALDYLALQAKTPTEVVDIDGCFILPSVSAGPVVFLTSSNDVRVETLLHVYTNATLVATPPHLGTAPYQVYVLTAKPEPAAVPHAFNQGLQLLSPSAQFIHDFSANAQWLTIRWSIMNAHSTAFRTSYGFNLRVQSAAGTPLSSDHSCTTTSTWSGDQLFDTYGYKAGTPIPAQITLQASTFIAQPQPLALGPLTGFTYYESIAARQALLTDDGKNSITISTVDTRTTDPLPKRESVVRKLAHLA
ncbi:MAG: glycosyltransferase family 39 protein [Chloroflexota bacterium]|nr:glycosyltransferase family 39 protein [Chloroflexota bacterium]